MRSRSYDKEFKINAVNLYKSGKTAGQVCKDLNIPSATFSGWIKENETEKGNCFNGSGKPKPANEEMIRLQKELSDVKLERDILKKAIAIFSQQK